MEREEKKGTRGRERKGGREGGGREGGGEGDEREEDERVRERTEREQRLRWSGNASRIRKKRGKERGKKSTTSIF